jgi:hypothetical protein
MVCDSSANHESNDDNITYNSVARYIQICMIEQSLLRRAVNIFKAQSALAALNALQLVTYKSM